MHQPPSSGALRLAPLRSFAIALFALALASCQGTSSRALELAEQARTQREAGALAAARVSIDAAIRERDDIAELYLEKARIALGRAAPGEAFEAYKSASSLDTANMEALQGISQLGLAIGRSEEADAAADRILVVLPTDSNALFTKGLLQLSRRQADSAMQYAERILAVDPRDVRGLILKARTLFFLGKTADALSAIDRGVGDATPDPALLSTYLELHREQGDGPAMLRDLAALRRTNTSDLTLPVLEAFILYKTGNNEVARRLLMDVATSDKVTPQIMSRIGTIWHQYDPDPAAGSNPPAFATSLARLETARYYLDLGTPRKAIWLLGSDPSAAAQALRYRAYLALRPEADLQGAVDAILADDATQCDALLARAAIASTRNDAVRAVADAQRAIAECPQNSGGYRTLANIRLGTGDVPGELRAYVNGLSTIPLNLRLSQDYLARAVAVGDNERAVAIARQIARAVPSWPIAWNLLAEACSRTGKVACRSDAKRREALAKNIYAMDPMPGEATNRGLLGRLQR